VQQPERVQRYVPSLEGIRGYGFLLVFCAHYFPPKELGHPNTVRLAFLTSLWSIAIFAVPVFFVLSGYLIGGILYDTRHRVGFFKVFYSRRILRVFPVYYVTLLAIVVFLYSQRIAPNLFFWSHFLYIQNLLPGNIGWQALPVTTVHFWSLAVEEQFYLLWPLIVWCFPEKKKLLVVSLTLIAGCFAFRFAAPMLFQTPGQISTFTPVRVDAILLGVVLALIRGDALFDRITRFAKWIVLAGGATVILIADWKGDAWARSFQGLQIGLPIVNITAAALIVAVVEEGSLLNRICSQRWACWLGSLSYSLYVFHLVYAHLFNRVSGWLCTYIRHSFAVLTSGALAFALTLALSLLSYLLIEGPIMKLKKHVRYGAKVADMPVKVGEPVFAKTGA
jgi:peptidoglycan/LPS O-acetylase OafA/YrhL